MGVTGGSEGCPGAQEGLPLDSLKTDESWKVGQRSDLARPRELPFFKTVSVGNGPHGPPCVQLKLLDKTLLMSHSPGMQKV